MIFFFILLSHVFSAPSDPELLLVETSDGIVYGVDPFAGVSLWSILTGPPLISTNSFVEGIDLHITQEGSIYFIDRATSSSLKLSKSIFEIVNNGPMRAEEIPEILIFGNKNIRTFLVNARNGTIMKSTLLITPVLMKKLNIKS